MNNLAERIAAECENIDRALSEMPSADDLGKLSSLELAGVAALLHDVYNGIENVLKQVLSADSIPPPTGDSWHRDLLAVANSNEFISDETTLNLRRYLAFRHFFAHGYSLDIDPERLVPLVRDIKKCVSSFRDGIDFVVAKR
jgi:uncharacterized protein YutE (UPF0331/DUF86 family)